MLRWFCALVVAVTMLFALPVSGSLGEVNTVSPLDHLDVQEKQVHDSFEDTVIHFPDPNFEAVVRNEIGKPYGEITASDVAVITRLWINDDTFLNENAVKVLVDGCRCWERESVIVGAIGSERHPGPTYGGRNAQAVLLAPNGTWQKCQLFNGNCVLIPATVFDRLGNLDEHFHHALGDFEYGLRAIAAGIDSYLTPCYVGTCEKHTSLPDWCNPEVSFRKRWQLFFSPLGCSPKDLFYFNRKYRNLFWAVGVLASNFLRVCFPQYWCQSKEKK